jgi:Family of unknown function (DUF5723)
MHIPAMAYMRSFFRPALRSALTALALLPAALHGQYGLQTGQLSGSAWSQRFQPANIAEGDYQKFRYSAQGAGWVGNTDLKLQGLWGGYISNAEKDEILAQIDGGLQASGGYNVGAANVNVRLGSQVLAISLDQDLSATGHLGNGNTIGLVLKGNQPYSGTSVVEDGLWATYTQTRTLGIGSAWKFGDFSLGARLNVIQGSRFAELDHATFDIYTAPDGEYIDIDAEYDIYTTPQGATGPFRFNGMGAGIDLGLAYQVGEKLRLDAALIGAGFTDWKGIQVRDTVQVRWEGVSIANLLEDSLPAEIEQQVDSLRGLLFPDTVDAERRILLPFQIRIGGSYALGEHSVIGLQLVYVPMRSGAQTPMPVINVNYRHEVIPGLQLGANAYLGGVDGFGFGAMAAYALPIGTGKLHVMAGGDNLVGLIAPGVGRGFSVYGGIGFDL